jgi:phosphoribosylformimino-5-aminoimidazole carboxamide ribotide isomerase
MIVYPAIDLRGGRAVQLVGGQPGAERVSLPDPVAVAEDWVRTGFRALHVVDLDAALGEGSNHETILAILEAVTVPVQVGGGIRDDNAAARLLEAGAARVITGTRAIEDPDWLAGLAARWPDQVAVAVDIRDGRVLARGWTATTALDATSFIQRLDVIPLAAVIVTDVTREGQLKGVDTDCFAGLARISGHPLQAAGGITNLADLRALAAVGVAGAVVGMSIYTGAIDPRATIMEFNQ